LLLQYLLQFKHGPVKIIGKIPLAQSWFKAKVIQIRGLEPNSPVFQKRFCFRTIKHKIDYVN